MQELVGVTAQDALDELALVSGERAELGGPAREFLLLEVSGALAQGAD